MGFSIQLSLWQTTHCRCKYQVCWLRCFEIFVRLAAYHSDNVTCHQTHTGVGCQVYQGGSTWRIPCGGYPRHEIPPELDGEVEARRSGVVPRILADFGRPHHGCDGAACELDQNGLVFHADCSKNVGEAQGSVIAGIIERESSTELSKKDLAWLAGTIL